MGDFYITAISDVHCPYPLHPGWSFRDGETKILSNHRTQNGKLFSYQWARYFKYRVPLEFVDSSGAFLLNSWWREGQTVAFTLDSSQIESTVRCKIVNTTIPINRFMRPYRDWYAGELQLEALEDSVKTARPFIVDDQAFGLLDQPYTVLWSNTDGMD